MCARTIAEKALKALDDISDCVPHKGDLIQVFRLIVYLREIRDAVS